MVANAGGKSSPVVFTTGTTPDDAYDTHDMTNLATGEGLAVNVGEPVTNYYFVLFDSGCTAKCGNCQGDVQDTLYLQARELHDELQSSFDTLGQLGETFEVTTRAIGYGGDAEPMTGPIPFEYNFTVHGELDGLALPDRHLGVGLTRLGELSTITTSTVEAYVVGTVDLQRTPEQAIEQLEATVLGQYPTALDIEVVSRSLGYQLAEAETSRVLEPSTSAEVGASPVTGRRSRSTAR